MLPVDTIAEGLANGVDKWHFADRYLGTAIRRLVEKEGLPMPLNPAVRQGEYRVSPRSISKPEVMEALERVGISLRRKWQYKSSGVISSFYEGTYGSTEVHCDWECKWNSPEAGSFTLYFRPPSSVTQTHWSYLAYYEKESFSQHLEEIIIFLNKLTQLSDEFENLFAKAEKKLSIRKTLLTSMLRRITAEAGLCYALQQNAHSYRLLVCMHPSAPCLSFQLPPPADAAQVQQMMVQMLQLIHEMPEACGRSNAFRFCTEEGSIPPRPAKRTQPLTPQAQRLQDALEPLCTDACSFCHGENASTLCVQLKHERNLRLRISHGISSDELAALPRRIRKVAALLNAAGKLKTELGRIPAEVKWTQNPS